MANLTTEFDALLKGHQAAPTKPFSPDTADEFLKEAYRINSVIARLHTELRRLRQAYLSTAAPRKTHLRTAASRSAPSQHVDLTDRDREEIDANAKMTLRDLNAQIRALEEAEQLRQSTGAALLRKRLSRGLGVLGSWAAGDAARSEQATVEAAARQLGAHRESVIWFLRVRLQETARTQQRMMETRLTREMEKNRSVLAKARSPAMAMPGNGIAKHSAGKLLTTNNARETGLSVQEEEKKKQQSAAVDNLTDHQKQIFEKGNQDMLKHFESTLDKVRTAENSLIEIAELQNLLVSNLATQSAHIDQLVADSFETTEGIGKGNKELKKSAGRASPARYTFFAAAGLCTALILWDLII
ncbi:uncharacterized protein B0T15DRAFT_483809 [Chaetomium strumarium]|uniref:t-SNARE coiled-coil homology domain-containing protein n=1 Tax=Chaetomium strumarium TaxID=1170767 RepID=A0AAJ0GV59_9PEZI|nr:hypothetical protein B0T15DRAFT_483809 [Chaetomium strumarium]